MDIAKREQRSFSHIESNDGLRGKISESLYRRQISDGQSSEVYQVEASISRSGQNTDQLACKRLYPEATRLQFIREYRILCSTNKHNHRNIVQFVAAFSFQENAISHHNFLFPLASGTLKQLFAGQIRPELTEMELESLWTQFEGLASAVSYLHEECKTAHRDLKASNILLYRDPELKNIIAKITDFGLATKLRSSESWVTNTAESRSAFQLGAPEMRKYETSAPVPVSTRMPENTFPSPSELQAADVWTLGCVFTLLLTFLVIGVSGEKEFRNAIRTTIGHTTTDQLDDGVQIKPEVLQWLSRLSRLNLRAKEISVLVKEMLATALQRPISIEWVQKPSRIDEWKHYVERKLDARIDWWPLAPPSLPCPQGYIRISWEWNKRCLYVDVLETQGIAYRRSCLPISQMPVNSAGLPLYGRRSGLTSSASQTQLTPSGFRPNNQQMHPPLRLSEQAPVAPQSNNSVMQQRSKEIYWCVDKVWTEPSQTLLQSSTQIHNDNALYKFLYQGYMQVQGWIGRMFSWKMCIDLNFVQFCRLSNNGDRVIRLATGLPPHALTNYEFHRFEPESVHMAIAAKQIVTGMYENTDFPDLAKENLQMVPQNIACPLGSQKGVEGWGMYAIHGYSLRKILYWIVAITVLGLVFVILWLSFVDKTDLQNAFVPAMFLSTMIFMGLAVPQVLGAA
ncbi:hypothetical protein JMJ35_000781 [Cladonia borealis]|uniref:Protein kinase domain-containing protein n=1 Tax=Cladonia borealis TaxID=184061 RepID=A0AA39V4Q3_9LECA|nr:hypothetical protein JMJ35_000781 [Cladonia borealis]